MSPAGVVQVRGEPWEEELGSDRGNEVTGMSAEALLFQRDESRSALARPAQRMLKSLGARATRIGFRARLPRVPPCLFVADSCSTQTSSFLWPQKAV